MDEKITTAIRDKARELLEQKKVHCVIGYERATDNLTARPVFVYKPDQVNRLIFDETCVHNLSKYLINKNHSVTAIVAKPCDARGVNLLVNENQVKRDKVVILGVVCPGVVETEWGKKGEAQLRCKECPQHNPPVYDALIGEPVKEAPAPEKYTDVAAIDGRSSAEKQAFWLANFNRCIRCYACRNACPGCYCPICFVDIREPMWAGPRVAPGENWMWNAVRAFHLLGRCVSCGQCQRVCPVGIPLMLLNRKLEKEVAEAFGFTPGMDPQAPAPLATFKKEELAEAAK